MTRARLPCSLHFPDLSLRTKVSIIQHIFFSRSHEFTNTIYNIFTGQEKYNSTIGTKLDIIQVITGQERYIPTVGNNLDQVAAQQYQPLLHLFLSTNGGGTTHTAAVVRRHEGKELDHHRLRIRSRRCAAPSGYRRFSTITLQELLYKEPALTDDLVHHGGSTKRSARYRGDCFHPERFTTLAELFGQTPDE